MFKKSRDKFCDPGNDSVQVTDQRTDNSSKNRVKHRKPNLKPVFCYFLCFSIGLFSDSVLEFLILFGLFVAFAFLPD